MWRKKGASAAPTATHLLYEGTGPRLLAQAAHSIFSLRNAPPSHGSTQGSKPLLGSQTRQVVLVDCLVG